MIYLITYDKNTIFKNYTPLYNSIKRSCSSWWHHLNNTWLINSELTSQEIFQNVSHCISQNDKLLIIQIHPNADYNGWLSQDAWNWINDQQNNKYGI